VPTPIGPATFNGLPAERLCRSLNVILLTDGDETCDAYNTSTYPNAEGLAVFEAGRLYTTGVTANGLNFKVKTYAIGFAGATVTALNNIAAAGGTSTAYSVQNETQLFQALSGIVAGAVKPERCNNADDNCNGCTDEGFTHYCDTGQTCCAWTTAANRLTCTNGYLATITAANPSGDKTKLPCTTPAQQADPASWLCYDPGDVCDGVDNNCSAGVDESLLKCGSPAHCPTAEICNGQDDNCNGAVDEGSVCSGTCLVAPSSEVCDGCDNDCDGVTDNGTGSSIPCGQPAGPTTPSNCIGTITCKPGTSVPKGACASGGGFTTCSYLPQVETCNGLDDDCNGIADDNISSVACVPAGTPPTLVYGGASSCRKGNTRCSNGVTTCVGFVGPSAEVCDGVDNDCNGVVDNAVPGVGLACGKNQAPCTPGVTACVSGVIVCSGGVLPKQEVCNGVDDDCNGKVDDGALGDAPAAGKAGCWSMAGSACQFPATGPTVSWTPPPGATCDGLGALTTPCQAGLLTCVAGAWTCKGGVVPAPETCNAIDDDCNGTIDDGAIPGVGVACGNPQPPCSEGVTVCGGGKIVCDSPTTPSKEICDGIDNDCNGVPDDGIAAGAKCDMAYDTAVFPGARDKGPCKQGVLRCDGAGNMVCTGGIGPVPELCNGVDDDCNGVVDDVTTASEPQLSKPCDVPSGGPPCKAGALGCFGGVLVCLGAVGTFAEVCNGQDDDCNGTADDGAKCPAGYDCTSGGCYATCDVEASAPCPGGYLCVGGHCKPSDCACDKCQKCANGKCVDFCSDVACPTGWKCACGACVAEAGPDAGVDGGSDAGSDGGSEAGDGGLEPGTGTPSADSGGCGCAVPGEGPPTPTLLVLAGVALTLGALRRAARKGGR
jgi:hypothetical protein